jgi:hypothetical protein
MWCYLCRLIGYKSGGAMASCTSILKDVIDIQEVETQICGKGRATDTSIIRQCKAEKAEMQDEFPQNPYYSHA